MSITAEAPEGGVIVQLGGSSRPLLLRNGEIERFEKHHDLSIFVMLDMALAKTAKSHHCRDLVALGLVGAGMSDEDADKLVSELAPHQNLAISNAATKVIFAAFLDPDAKKKDDQDGSLESQDLSKDTIPPKK